MIRTCRTINCPHPAMILSELCLSHALQRDAERNETDAIISRAIDQGIVTYRRATNSSAMGFYDYQGTTYRINSCAPYDLDTLARLVQSDERLRATETPPMFHEVYLTDEEQERYWEIENDYTTEEIER